MWSYLRERSIRRMGGKSGGDTRTFIGGSLFGAFIENREKTCKGGYEYPKASPTIWSS